MAGLCSSESQPEKKQKKGSACVFCLSPASCLFPILPGYCPCLPPSPFLDLSASISAPPLHCPSSHTCPNAPQSLCDRWWAGVYLPSYMPASCTCCLCLCPGDIDGGTCLPLHHACTHLPTTTACTTPCPHTCHLPCIPSLLLLCFGRGRGGSMISGGSRDREGTGRTGQDGLMGHFIITGKIIFQFFLYPSHSVFPSASSSLVAFHVFNTPFGGGP